MNAMILEKGVAIKTPNEETTSRVERGTLNLARANLNDASHSPILSTIEFIMPLGIEM